MRDFGVSAQFLTDLFRHLDTNKVQLRQPDSTHLHVHINVYRLHSLLLIVVLEYSELHLKQRGKTNLDSQSVCKYHVEQAQDRTHISTFSSALKMSFSQ